MSSIDFRRRVWMCGVWNILLGSAAIWASAGPFWMLLALGILFFTYGASMVLYRAAWEARHYWGRQ